MTVTKVLFSIVLLCIGAGAKAAPLRDVELRFLAPPTTELYSAVSSLALLPPGYELSGNCAPVPIDSRYYAPGLTADAHAEISRLFGWTDAPPEAPVQKATVLSRIWYVTSLSFLGPLPQIVIQVPPSPGTRNAYRLLDSGELSIALASAGVSLNTLGKGALTKVTAAAKVDGVMSVGAFLRMGSEDHSVRVSVEGKICVPPRREVWEHKVEESFSPSVLVVEDGQPVESSVRISLLLAVGEMVRQSFGEIQVHPSVITFRAPGGRCGRHVLKAMEAGGAGQQVREQLKISKDAGHCKDSEVVLLDGLISLYEGKPEQAVAGFNFANEVSGRKVDYNDARVAAATLQRASLEVQRYSQAGVAEGPPAAPDRDANARIATAMAPTGLSGTELMYPVNPETVSCPAWMTLGPSMVVAIGTSDVTGRCSDTLARCADTLLESETKTVIADFELTPEDLVVADMARLVARSTRAQQVVLLRNDGGRLVVQRLSVGQEGDFKAADGCEN